MYKFSSEIAKMNSTNNMYMCMCMCFRERFQEMNKL